MHRIESSVLRGEYRDPSMTFFLILSVGGKNVISGRTNTKSPLLGSHCITECPHIYFIEMLANHGHFADAHCVYLKLILLFFI